MCTPKVPEPIGHAAKQAASAAIGSAREQHAFADYTSIVAGSMLALAITTIKEIVAFGTITTVPLTLVRIRCHLTNVLRTGASRPTLASQRSTKLASALRYAVTHVPVQTFSGQPGCVTRLPRAYQAAA